MPHSGHSVVAVTPAGRRKYLELLLPQLKAYHDAGVLDRWQLWCNTIVEDDIAYMQQLAHEHPEFITLRRLPVDMPVHGNMTIHYFFKECIEPNTVYVRFDDDIIVLDEITAFKAFLDFRIANPQFFMVYATIINNALITHILQRHGVLSLANGISGYECMDSVGWSNPHFAQALHEQVTKEYSAAGSLAKYRFDKQWIAHHYERISINCLSWLGDAFARDTNGVVDKDEEYEIAVNIPKKLNKYNTVFGGFCCVHWAFYTQRAHLESSTNLLNDYRAALEQHVAK